LETRFQNDAEYHHTADHGKQYKIQTTIEKVERGLKNHTEPEKHHHDNPQFLKSLPFSLPCFRPIAGSSGGTGGQIRIASRADILACRYWMSACGAG
jgi:hypothetical protein